MNNEKSKKILIIIAIAVVLILGIVYMIVHFSNSMGMNSEVQKYKALAVEYAISQLKADGKYNPNEEYRLKKTFYSGKDNSGDKIPYSTIKFYIGDNTEYIVTMEKNASGEFEITNFEEADN